MARVLHIHVNAVQGVNGADQVTVNTELWVGNSEGEAIATGTEIVITLKTLGLYKSEIAMNQALETGAKAYLNSEYSIPTNGYAKTYVHGGYDLLNIL